MSFLSWVKGLGDQSRLSNTQSFFYNQNGGFNFKGLSDAKAMEMYVSAAAIYSVVKTCADGVRDLPIVLAIDKGDELEPVKSGEAHDFIFKPNDQQTLSELWELQALYYFINGEFYNYHKVDSVGFLGETISLPPETMKVILDKQNSLLSSVQGYEFTDGGVKETIEKELINHTMMTNPTLSGRRTRNGLSPLQSGFSLANAAVNTETFISWYFENRGVSSLISGSGDPTMSLQDKDKKALRNAFRNDIGGAERANGVEIIGSPVTVNQLNASSTDMQTVQQYNKTVERIAALYNLPAPLVQINENSTYNNVIEATKKGYTECYIPTAQKFIDGYDRNELKMLSERDGVKYVMYVDKDKIEALQPNPFERKKSLQEEVKIGAITRNEYRVATGRELSTEKEMDVPSIQNNLIPVTEIGNGERK